MQNIEFDKRKSGIRLIDNLTWGTHFCLFYETEKDLLEILVPYFRAGLIGNEFCVWVISAPLKIADVKRALQKAVPNFETYTRRRQIEIIPSSRWPSGKATSDKMIAAKFDKSLSGSFNGLRFGCNAFPEKKNDKSFTPYFAETIARYSAVGAFSYPRDEFDALGLMEVVKKHHFALVRNAGRWEVLESSEARIVQNELKRSEEKLRSLFNSMSEGFAYLRVVLDDKGRPSDCILLEVNPAFEKLTGLKAKNIIGKRATEILPDVEKDPTDWIGKFGEVALSGRPVHFESYAEVLKRWYAVSAFSPYKGYFAITFSDVTIRRESLERLAAANEELSASNEELRVETEERQRIEETLRESEVRLKKTQEIAHLGSWELDVINNHLYWSDEVYRIFGLKPQEFKATYEAFLERVHPDDRKAVDKAYTGSLRRGRDSYEIEHRVVKKSTGEIRYVHEKCEHIRNAAGKIIRSVGMVQDVTGRKLAEDALEEARRDLELKVQQRTEELKRSSQKVINILETLTDGFFTLDLGWRFTYYNSAAERITGIRREDLLGREVWELFPKAKNSKIHEEFVNCMMQKIPVSFEVLSLYSNKWMEVHAYPSEEGLSVYFKDITEKKAGEEKLKEAQAHLEGARRLSDIGTLAATVAHELRNPLAAIHMAAFNIKRKAQNPLLEKHILNIDKKISESDQIINNLLFYSRLRQPYFESVDLYKIMEECLEVAKKRAVKDEVVVRKKYKTLMRIPIDADSLQMKELFGNILNNAYDAMHRKPGTIEVAARGENGNVKIFIKDAGVGMDEEHLKRAYEPFFTTKAKGTGLGLTVCFQIVNLHNGKIELASEKGKGTTVTVTLPMKRPISIGAEGEI